MELVCPEEFYGWPFWLFDIDHLTEMADADCDLYGGAHHAYAMACAKTAADRQLTNPMTGEPITVKEPPQSGPKFDAYQHMKQLGQHGIFLALGMQNELLDGERAPQCAIIVNDEFDPASIKNAQWCQPHSGYLSCPSGKIMTGLGEDPTGEYDTFYQLPVGEYDVNVHEVDHLEMEINKVLAKYKGPDQVIQFNLIPAGSKPQSQDPFLFP